jgi:hypothetical protein
MEYEALWMRCVEALFLSGKSFAASIEIADRLMAARFREGRMGRPGLAKTRGVRGVASPKRRAARASS